MDTASLILFGIRAAVRLGEASFNAYVDMTRNRDLVLPLPDDFLQLPPELAYRFFYDSRGDGRQFYDPNLVDDPIFDKPWSRVVALKKEFSDLSEVQKAELVSLAQEGKRLIAVAKESYAVLNTQPIPVSDMIALTTITGWQVGKSDLTAIQHVAGTLIEIGVDYAVQDPSLFDTKSTVGKSLYMFINELDKIPFSDVDLDELPARLFVAVLETASANPEIFTGDKRTQTLVSSAGKKVALLVSDRIKSINEQDLTVTEKRARRRDMEEWGELVFRGVLDSAGRLALSEPGQFLEIEDVGTQELISRVGNDVIDLMLGQDNVSLDPVFSREGTERLMRTALDVVAKHPKLVTGSAENTALNNILTGVAKELCTSEGKLLRDDLLPDVARLVLEKTGDNLSLLWPTAPNSPEKNLLLVAAKSILKSVSRPTADGTWHPDFTDEDMLFVIESVFDEVKRNPAWITGDNAFLESALTRVLDETLKTIQDKKVTLTRETTVAILGNVVKGVALRKEFFDDFDHGDTVKPIVVAAVDAVLSTVFETDDANVRWQLVRDDLLDGLVEVTISELAKSKADAGAIEELKQVLSDLVEEIKKGKTIDLDVFRTALNSRLGSGIALEGTQ